MNKGIEVNVLFDDGSKRQATITPGAMNLVKRFAGAMPSLFEGTGMNPLDADFSSIIAVTRADHDKIHQIPTAFRKADFRLGQMDMKESIIDMLQKNAETTSGLNRAVLQAAIDEIRKMEVSYADTGE